MAAAKLALSGCCAAANLTQKATEATSLIDSDDSLGTLSVLAEALAPNRPLVMQLLRVVGIGEVAVQWIQNLVGGLTSGDIVRIIEAVLGVLPSVLGSVDMGAMPPDVIENMVPILVRVAKGEWSPTFIDLVSYVGPMIEEATGFDPAIAVRGIDKIINVGPADGIVYLINGYAPPAIGAFLSVLVLGGGPAEILDALLQLN